MNQKTLTKNRGHYTNWLSSPYINDILREYKRCGYNARRTVDVLQRDAPDDRFVRLTHTTLLRWHDEQHKLLPQLQRQYDEGRAAARSTGRASALSQFPELENHIKNCLLTDVYQWAVRSTVMLFG